MVIEYNLVTYINKRIKQHAWRDGIEVKDTVHSWAVLCNINNVIKYYYIKTQKPYYNQIAISGRYIINMLNTTI